MQAVTEYLKSWSSPPIIVDLGCGDFNVGKHFVDFAREYHACDIVPELQEYNRRRYQRQNLYFPCVNLIEDALPDGDIVFIRQVFQHLGNAQIEKALAKCKKYGTWIVTEHLPAGDDFTPNIDISAGCGIRGLVNSGVVITAPPFSLQNFQSRSICEIPYNGDVIRTMLFERQNILRSEA